MNAMNSNRNMNTRSGSTNSGSGGGSGMSKDSSGISREEEARRLRDALLLNLMGTLYQLARDFKRARHCFTVATMYFRTHIPL
jgi:hypothetical protein